MDPNSPRMLSAWANQITLEFMQFNVDINNKFIIDTIMMNLSLHGIAQPTNHADLAFKWKTQIFYHPGLTAQERLNIQPWEIKNLHKEQSSLWEAFYEDWYKPVEEDSPIILGLVNSAMNMSYAPEDWKKLLPQQMHPTIDRYMSAIADPQSPKLSDEDVAAFHKRYARIEQRVKERLAKNLLLKGM